MITAFTRDFKVERENDVYRFAFYCGLCRSAYLSPEVKADSAEEAIKVAEPEARRHFNRCHCCGLWVCDAHYDEEYMVCVQCSTQKGTGSVDNPRICKECGNAMLDGDRFCRMCGEQTESI